MKPIILLFSGKARHGKDTSVDYLLSKINKDKERGIRISYGDYLKYVATNIFKWNGEKDDAGRSLLQKIGVDFREKNPNFWVNNAINLVEVLDDSYEYVLISDCRFENDIKRWIECGYKVITIKVCRDNFDNGLTEEQKAHPSETGLDNFDFHIEIHANSIEELKNELTRQIPIDII